MWSLKFSSFKSKVRTVPVFTTVMHCLSVSCPCWNPMKQIFLLLKVPKHALNQRSKRFSCKSPLFGFPEPHTQIFYFLYHRQIVLNAFPSTFSLFHPYAIEKRCISSTAMIFFFFFSLFWVKPQEGKKLSSAIELFSKRAINQTSSFSLLLLPPPYSNIHYFLAPTHTHTHTAAGTLAAISKNSSDLFHMIECIFSGIKEQGAANYFNSSSTLWKNLFLKIIRFIGRKKNVCGDVKWCGYGNNSNMY